MIFFIFKNDTFLVLIASELNLLRYLKGNEKIQKAGIA